MNRVNKTKSAVLLYCRFSLYLKDPFSRLLGDMIPGLQLRVRNKKYISYFSTKKFVGTQKNRLNEKDL